MPERYFLAFAFLVGVLWDPIQLIAYIILVDTFIYS